KDAIIIFKSHNSPEAQGKLPASSFPSNPGSLFPINEREKSSRMKGKIKGIFLLLSSVDSARFSRRWDGRGAIYSENKIRPYPIDWV
ncbi:hypothetical protein CEXT_488151, partial [Caerostris extrusa]